MDLGIADLRVAVVGAGTMGRFIAMEFALHGHPVSLVDLSQEILGEARQSMRDSLLTLAEAGVPGASAPEAVLERIVGHTCLSEAVQMVDYVVEAVPEDLALKQVIFAELAARCPSHTILASNTSGLSVQALAQASGQSTRTLITHYWNPPHLLPLVEVVPSDGTSPSTLDTVQRLLGSMGKKVVLLQKDVPGFIGNRLQYALLREALSLVQRGVASPADVDTVVKYSIGRRLGTIGPLETADFGGIDVFHAILSYLAPDLDRATEPGPLLSSRLAAGRLGVKSGQGIYEWPAEKARALRERRDRELLRWLAADQKTDGSA